MCVVINGVVVTGKELKDPESVAAARDQSKEGN